MTVLIPQTKINPSGNFVTPSTEFANPAFVAHMSFAAAALEGLIRQCDSMVVDKGDICDRAWQLADEMVESYRRRGGNLY